MKVPIHVRFKDIDIVGHVNNAVYLSYFEEARIAYFKVFAPDNDWSDKSLLLAHAELDYLQPIKLKDQVHIEIWCSNVGTKSFDLSYEIHRSDGSANSLCTKGKTTMVSFDGVRDVTTEIPTEWLPHLKG